MKSSNVTLVIVINIIVCIFLNNCTTHQAYVHANSTADRLNINTQQLSLNQITKWDNSGAIAARTQNKSWSASYNWHQQGKNNYQISLFGPFGNGSAIIERKNNITTYSNGVHTHSAHNADQLLAQYTGIALPVNNLYYWVRGLPAPDTRHTAQHNADNNLITLKQDGYTIEYTNYQSVSGVSIPTQIKIHGKDIIMKMMIKHWSLKN